MTLGGAVGLTASAFRHLADSAAPELNRARATATFAWTVGGSRSPGATWINVRSSRGYGRLIRHSDGSFDSSSHDGDGGQLHRAHGARVTADDLLALIISLAGDGGPRRPGNGQAPRSRPATD